MRLFRLLAVLPLLAAPALVRAQTWNGPRARALVAAAIERRTAARRDTTLHDYRARAHGFVFFLGQIGEGLEEPPRLIKSDELVLEVYWKAPSLSKQRIVGWRDRVDLPTDIRYHRDHLGIVQNEFGNRIRLGRGDEVRGVPHPLAPDGPERYDYALVDSVSIRLPARRIQVYRIRVRPRDPETPRVVGSLYLDVETEQLVLFQFSFTRRAYLDETLEDITVRLENGLWNGRYWLPRRQEIEIRRRTAWLDLPARGIIRGRWEIRAYRFNVGLADSVFRGPEIVAAPAAVRDTFSWDRPLAAAIEESAGPALTVDLEALRGEISRIEGWTPRTGLATVRPGVGSLSDLLHFNRVQGLTVGAGAVLRPGGGPTEIRAWGGYGVGDRRLGVRLALRHTTGRWRIGAAGGREVVDFAEEPVIAPLLNSILAQEAGDDFADYVLLERGVASLRHAFGVRGALELSAGVERSSSLRVRVAPATGRFRPNPPLGVGTLAVGRLTLSRRSPELPLSGGASGRLVVEGGSGEGIAYARLRGRGRLAVPLGATTLAARSWAGWGSAELPAYRAFVLGGRGSLVSAPFRRWGGRYAAFGVVEWRVPVPFPAAPLGPFTSTGGELVLAPFVAAGGAGGALSRAGLPWRASEGVQPVLGVAVEWFHRLLRLEVGVNPRTGRTGLVVDLGRDLWPIL